MEFLLINGDANRHGAEYYDYYYNLAENGYKRIQAFLTQKENELS